jgi:hypothetical protein
VIRAAPGHVAGDSERRSVAQADFFFSGLMLTNLRSSLMDSGDPTLREVACNFSRHPTLSLVLYLKSVNLQYNTLGCLDDGTNESSTKHLTFQVFFFS